MAHLGSADPSGWLVCDGRQLSKSDYPFLWDFFSNNGLDFGITSSTFNLPDMRGMFLRGIDDSRDLGSEQQDSIKSHTHNVSAQNVDTTSAGLHSHSSDTDTGGGHSHPVKDYYFLESSWAIDKATDRLINDGYDAGSESIGTEGIGVNGTDYDNNKMGYINHDTANVENHSHSFTTNWTGSHTHSLNFDTVSGSTGGTETRPKNFGIHHIIKY